VKYSNNREKYPGLYCSDVTELDDIAYELYSDAELLSPLVDNCWWTQHGFMNKMTDKEKEKYYEQANIILRGLKIDKLKNETKI